MLFHLKPSQHPGHLLRRVQANPFTDLAHALLEKGNLGGQRRRPLGEPVPLATGRLGLGARRAQLPLDVGDGAAVNGRGAPGAELLAARGGEDVVGARRQRQQRPQPVSIVAADIVQERVVLLQSGGLGGAEGGVVGVRSEFLPCLAWERAGNGVWVDGEGGLDIFLLQLLTGPDRYRWKTEKGWGETEERKEGVFEAVMDRLRTAVRGLVSASASARFRAQYCSAAFMGAGALGSWSSSQARSNFGLWYLVTPVICRNSVAVAAVEGEHMGKLT